ncbi:MAG: hypothetical protein ABIQ15_14365 [Nocardioides sp.]
MRFLDRLRGSAPPRGCECPEHVADLLGLRIPLTAEMRAVDGEELSVGELLETGALAVDEVGRQDRWLTLADQRTGPFEWSLWVGDEARALYDDDAPVALDDALRSQQGIDLVEWEDREAFWVGAPTMCPDGVLASAARALADPRVRLA